MHVHAIRAAVVCLATIVGAATAAASDAYKVAAAEVTVVCPLTVGGSFEARTKSVSGDMAPGVSDAGKGGEVRVDLRTLETGIALRDRHMKTNYLEVDKSPDYAVAILTDVRVEKLDGKTAFTGTLSLHGHQKAVKGTADLQQRDGRVRVQAAFPIRVSEFEIPAPTYLGVGVRDEIQVKIDLTAVPTAAATTTASGVRPRR